MGLEGGAAAAAEVEAVVYPLAVGREDGGEGGG